MNSVNKGDIGNIRSDSVKTRFGSLLKQKLPIIVIILASVAFIIKDALTVGVTDADLWIIISNMTITYIYTLYTTSLFGKMGRKKGKESDEFIATMMYYSKSKKDTEAIRNHLPTYCSIRTAEAIQEAQKEILDEELLDYEKFKNNLYDYNKLTPEEKKCYTRAKKVKLTPLQARDLVSERGRNRKTKNSLFLGEDEAKFSQKNNLSNAFTKIIFPITFSYIAILGISFQGLLFGLVQVSIILLGGVVNYLTNEDYTMNELRNRFINKADCLIDFQRMYEGQRHLFISDNTHVEDDKTKTEQISITESKPLE